MSERKLYSRIREKRIHPRIPGNVDSTLDAAALIGVELPKAIGSKAVETAFKAARRVVQVFPKSEEAYLEAG